MNSVEYQMLPDEPRPRTLTVLALLLGAALVFSWLGAYAVSNALLAAELISPWHGEDPRPRWMLMGFLSILAGFVLVSGFFRWLSERQIRRIDAMAEAE